MSEEKCPISEQTRAEEFANWITHGIGLVLSLVALIALIVASIFYTSPLLIAGSTIFGVSLVMLYGVSTAYHWVETQSVKRIFRILDHSCIYLLIAGTYTPYAFGPLRGAWGWTIFAAVWTSAIIGIILKTFRLKKGGILSTVFYLAMGWMCMIAILPLYRNLSVPQFSLLLTGGAFYSLGTIFYSIKKIPYSHAIWHLFVLGGSICHFASIFAYICSDLSPFG